MNTLLAGCAPQRHVGMTIGIIRTLSALENMQDGEGI